MRERERERETQDARRESLFDWPVAFTKRERERESERENKKGLKDFKVRTFIDRFQVTP